MTAARLKLEVFDTGGPRPSQDEARVTAAALDDARAASYETGYAAGWEDAVSAQTTDQSRMAEEVARNLQALSFTYHEARSHVLRRLEPLLKDMVAKVLPGMARESLGHFVLEALRPMASQMTDMPVTLSLNPASRAAVETYLAEETSLPVQIVEEPSLGEGQVFMRFDDQEKQVDLDGVITAIAGAVDSFFHFEQQEKAHG